MSVMSRYKLCVHLVLILRIAEHTRAQISQQTSESCLQNVTDCLPLVNETCMGFDLSFAESHLGLVDASENLAAVKERLATWSAMRYIPECWDVVQPFICSLYMPRCNNNTKTIELPSKELCERIKHPCKVIKTLNHGVWPDILDCNRQYFRTGGCGSPDVYEKLSSNIQGSCLSPLIETDDESSWFEEFYGCGIPCQNPLFTQDQHDEVHIFIAIFGTLSIIGTSFTLVTFAIDWKNAKRYPAIILFFINGCFFLGSIGWMAQFSGGARNDIVCRHDNTARRGEPQVGSGQSVSCTIVFLLVYFFSMAGVTWFVMLTMAWFITFRTLGSPRHQLTNKTAYFHIISWCFPLVLSIVAISVSEIDGDSMSGICFIGYSNHAVRTIFVIVPVLLTLIGALYFLIKGFIVLYDILKDTPETVSKKAVTKIKETIIRIGVFIVALVTFVLIMLGVHIYTFVNEEDWKRDLKDYIICKGNLTMGKLISNNISDICELKNPPSVAAIEFHIFAYFGTVLLMCSWSFNTASFYTWERFLRKKLNKPSNKPVKLKKHKMIARAFEKRKEINNGRLSISFYSTHDDPLGMRFDLNSVSSVSIMSSNFANAMPKLIKRRGGLVYPTAGTGRRYSDSDISIKSRRMSIDSDHNQPDFQVRIKPEELQQLRREHKKANKKRRKRVIRRVQPVISPAFNPTIPSAARRGRQRRNSDSSLISKASGQGVKVSLDCQSLDGGSNRSSLETITLPAPVFKRQDFSIFTASGFKGGGHSNGIHINKQNENVVIEMNPVRRPQARNVRNNRANIFIKNCEDPSAVNLSYDNSDEEMETTEVKLF